MKLWVTFSFFLWTEIGTWISNLILSSCSYFC